MHHTATPTAHASPRELARAAIDHLQPDAVRQRLGKRRLEAVWRDDTAAELPLLLGGMGNPPRTADPYPWQRFDHAEQFDDADKLLVEAVWTLLEAQGHPEARGDSQLAVRANFGTVVTATTFGVEARALLHTPPWIDAHLSRDETLKALARLDPTTAP